MENEWRKWCRLCAKEDILLNSVNVFSTKKNDGQSMLDSWSGELSVSAAIGKFFWVNISRSDDMPKVICGECFALLSKLVQFSERIVKVQNMFCFLQSKVFDKTNFNEVRFKCGLLDEDEIKVEPVSPTTVIQEEVDVYCVDEKHKMDDFVDKLQKEDTEIENSLKLKDCLIIKSEVIYDDPVEHCNIDDDDDMKESSTEFDDVDIGSISSILEQSWNGDKDAKKEEDINKKNHFQYIGSISSILEQSSNGDKDAEKEEDINKKNHFQYECSECPRKFKRLDHYRHHLKKIHQQKVHDESPFQCPLCKREYKTKFMMEQHKATHLPMEKRIPCTFCDRRFTNKWLLQSHVKNIHTRERPFICEQCGIAVYSAGNLKQHMLTHTDNAPFECEICKKCFKDNRGLRRHQQIHDENKYTCLECGQKLSSQSTLNRHLIIHSDKMKHKCDYCGREFKRSKTLKTHLILHIGLKPYVCDFCDRAFANGSNCRKHKKTFHPIELAAQEAGGAKPYVSNIPKLDTLKAISKSKHLLPIVSKQSGQFAFGKKPKLLTVNENAEKINERVDLKIEKPNEVECSQTSNCVIPTIDSIHQIMKQGTMNESAITIAPSSLNVDNN